MLAKIAYMGGLHAVLNRFCASWGRICLEAGRYGERVEIIATDESLHDVARNSLAAQADDAEWLLMLDADHDHPATVLGDLINVAAHCDAQIVSGVYRARRPPHSIVAYSRGPGGTLAPLKADDGENHEIAASGAGCLLVATEVFRRIRHRGEQPFDRIQFERYTLSEDLSFFHRCKYLDPAPKVVLATGVVSHHLQITPVPDKSELGKTTPQNRHPPCGN